MANLEMDSMRFGTTPDNMNMNALIARMYGGQNVRGPYFYPRSPYGLGDLVPGAMPTRFGSLKVFPGASHVLPGATLSTASQDFAVPQSLAQETGRYDMAGERGPTQSGAFRQSASAEAPLTPSAFMAAMPSMLKPRADYSRAGDQTPGFACWVQQHPLLSIGAAVVLFIALKGARK